MLLKLDVKDINQTIADAKSKHVPKSLYFWDADSNFVGAKHYTSRMLENQLVKCVCIVNMPNPKFSI
jgi:hypothetical protein